MNESIRTILGHSEDLIVELETLLTSIPAISPLSGGEGELNKCIALEAWLRKKGFSNLERHDAPDPTVPSGIRPNLVLTLPGSDDSSRLWIMSHLDVVPPGELSKWSSDPWTLIRKGSRLYGRGVEDNQQGLCASVAAALAVQSAGVTLPYTVKLLFVADEENGSEFGIQWLLQNRSLFNAGDMVLIPDGGDSEGLTMEVAEKNLLWLQVHTKGVQCHGSRPDQGVNAHLAACDLAVRLRSALMQAFSDRDPLFEPDISTFEPTKHEANVPNVNTIPGEDVFYMDMRVLPRYPLADVQVVVERVFKEIEDAYGVKISSQAVQKVESKATASDAPVVQYLAKAIRELRGIEARPIGIGGGTVGAYLRNAGIDAVVWGTLDETAHQSDEYAELPNILADAEVMAYLMTMQR